jgi:hypothetical protein
MSMRLWRHAGLISAALLLSTPALASDKEVEDVLRRQTQELLDAVTGGTPSVWSRYLHDKLSYTAEDGDVLTKAQMVEQIGPLPSGVSGKLQVTDFKVAVHDAVAIATYISDEHEDYHGHKLHCQYRSTDTWVKTRAGWRLIAGQVIALRTDPPAVPLTAAQMKQYVGRYALSADFSYEIRVKDGRLEGQQSGRAAEPLRAEAPDVLFVPGKPRYRKVVRRAPGGQVTGFFERREAWDLDWKRQ